MVTCILWGRKQGFSLLFIILFRAVTGLDWWFMSCWGCVFIVRNTAAGAGARPSNYRYSHTSQDSNYTYPPTWPHSPPNLVLSRYPRYSHPASLNATESK